MKEKLYQASKFLRAIGNQVRYMILKELLSGPKTPSGLASVLGRSEHNISQHLMVLRAMDVVRFKSVGKNVIYSIKSPKIQKIIELTEEYIRELALEISK